MKYKIIILSIFLFSSISAYSENPKDQAISSNKDAPHLTTSGMYIFMERDPSASLCNNHLVPGDFCDQQLLICKSICEQNFPLDTTEFPVVIYPDELKLCIDDCQDRFSY